MVDLLHASLRQRGVAAILDEQGQDTGDIVILTLIPVVDE